MIYSKADILAVWASIYKLAALKSEHIAHLSSSDYRYQDKTYCPQCRHFRHVLVRIEGTWKCFECAGIPSGEHPNSIRTAWIYRITNDLFEYFGELDSAKLFDSSLVEGFIHFAGLDKNMKAYMLFLELVKTILTKEVGALKIVSFLSSAEAQITREKKKRDKGNGTGIGRQDSLNDAPAKVASGMAGVAS